MQNSRLYPRTFGEPGIGLPHLWFRRLIKAALILSVVFAFLQSGVAQTNSPEDKFRLQQRLDKAMNLDCQKRALSQTQSALCQDPDLLWGHRTIAELYLDLRKAPSLNTIEGLAEPGEAAVELRREQRAWLQNIELCGADTSCIQTMHRERIIDLSQKNFPRIRHSNLDFYGSWIFESPEAFGGLILAATSQGQTFVDLSTSRRSSANQQCRIKFAKGQLFQNLMIWANKASLDGEPCALVISLDQGMPDGKARLLVEQRHCKAYWCSLGGQFEGYYVREDQTDLGNGQDRTENE